MKSKLAARGGMVPAIFNSVATENMGTFMQSIQPENISASIGLTSRPFDWRDSATKNQFSTRSSFSPQQVGAASSSVDGSHNLQKMRGVGGLLGIKQTSFSGQAEIAKMFNSKIQSPTTIDHSILSSTFGAAAPGDNMETASR